MRSERGVSLFLYLWAMWAPGKFVSLIDGWNFAGLDEKPDKP